jgi:hypothetical protein
MTLLFGLGDAPKAERVKIRWSDGKVEEWPDLAADRFYPIREGAGPGPGAGAGKAWKR